MQRTAPGVITAFGIAALSFMMAMYALERRDKRYILGFALGCALSSAYGFLSGAWPFGVVEALWGLLVIRRYRTDRAGARRHPREEVSAS